MLKQDKKVTEPTFFIDVPIREKGDDEFQFYHIAELLKSAIDTASKSMHICLAGQWGTGKSTVLSMLENMYQQESEKVKFVTISVWKFAENPTSLQRKMLRDLALEFGVDVEDEFERTKNRSENLNLGGFFAAMSKLIARQKPFWLVTTILFLMLWLSSYISVPMIKEILSSFSTGSYIIFMIGLIAKSQLTIGKTITYNDLPLNFSDQFENRFEKILKDQSENYKKIIIVFDDMDRLPHKQLYASLNTIRTFLRMKHFDNCTFIVPCDENILRGELKEALSDSEGDKQGSSGENQVSEFLNKTFDLMVKLPLVEQRNIRKYAHSLLLAQPNNWSTKHANSLNNLLSILIHSDITTPRQVKKILNAFTADWELAKRRDSENKMEFLTKNPRDLAIFTVLKTDYSHFYEALKEDVYLLKNVKSVDDILKRYGNKTQFPRLFVSKILKFIPDDIRPYLYFHNSELNPITGRVHLIQARNSFINGDEEVFRTQFTNLAEDEKFIILDFVTEEFGNEIELSNILGILFSDESYTKYISESHKQEWEYVLEHNIPTILDFRIENALKVFDTVVTSNIVWKKYGNQLVNKYSKTNFANHYSFKEFFEVWKQYPELVDRLNVHEKLARTLTENAYEIGLEEDNEYYVEEELLKLGKDHSLFRGIDWVNVLLNELNTSYENIDKPDVGDDDQDIDYSSMYLSFRLSDWLAHIEDMTGYIITSTDIDSFLSYRAILGDNCFVGLDSYITEIMIKSDSAVALTDILNSYAKYGAIELISEDALEKMNHFLAHHRQDSKINESIRNVVETTWKYSNKEAIYVMKYLNSIPSSINCIVAQYRFGSGVYDDVIRDIILDFDDKVSIKKLHNMVESQNLKGYPDKMHNLLSILEHSQILLNGYGELCPNEFDYEKFDSVRHAPHETYYITRFKLPLILKRDYENHLSDIEQEMKGLVGEHANLMNEEVYGYGGNWNEALNMLFDIYLEEMLNTNFRDWTEKFSYLTQNPNVVNHLTQTNRDKLITIASEFISGGNTKFNLFMLKYSSCAHKSQIKAFAKRFQFFTVDEQNKIVEKINALGEEDFDYFNHKLKNQLQYQPELE
ncbi:P-loop NTPase fold protein [Peribacillus frigoritolerans]|uniref:P-loop NTPase fold protein n=1 Tax=Peribacillus frigoritolerans TaxID=450367 RepID=UPI0024175190|nr:P-loop NTPase fold protein [Peribacillus frigoritolerans]MDG4850650.1 P-loop NTPase fold protein [Peribacillus frigoritolerans]